MQMPARARAREEGAARITAEVRVLGKERVLPRIGDEGQVARLRLLDARDINDVDVGCRAFETAA